MAGIDPRPSDVTVKARIARSFVGKADAGTCAFLLARVVALPLAAFDRHVADAGTIVEVGCGHGIVTQYMALRSPGRQVIGYDPDSRRISVARAAAGPLSNLEYRLELFEEGRHDGLAAVMLIGVLCLLDDATCRTILRAAHESLRPGGALVFSDVLKHEGTWRYRFHRWREHRFVRAGFTRADGVFFRSTSQWQSMLRDAGFVRIEPFSAPVPMHSVFNWVCS